MTNNYNEAIVVLSDKSREYHFDIMKLDKLIKKDTDRKQDFIVHRKHLSDRLEEITNALILLTGNQKTS